MKTSPLDSSPSDEKACLCPETATNGGDYSKYDTNRHDNSSETDRNMKQSVLSDGGVALGGRVVCYQRVRSNRATCDVHGAF